MPDVSNKISEGIDKWQPEPSVNLWLKTMDGVDVAEDEE